MTKTQIWCLRELKASFKDFIFEYEYYEKIEDVYEYAFGDSSLKTVFDRLSEDERDEVENEFEQSLYQPTKEEWEGDSKYDAMKDGD